MFNKLFANFGNITLFSESVQIVEELITHVLENLGKDLSAKDAAIDAICEILQEHKTSAKQ